MKFAIKAALATIAVALAFSGFEPGPGIAGPVPAVMVGTTFIIAGAALTTAGWTLRRRTGR